MLITTPEADAGRICSLSLSVFLLRPPVYSDPACKVGTVGRGLDPAATRSLPHWDLGRGLQPFFLSE